MKRILLILFFCAEVNIIFCQTSFEGTQYLGLFHSYPQEIIQTQASQFIIMGSSAGHGGVSAGNWLYKLDSLGNVIWQKIYSPPCGDANGYFIRETKSGNYLLSGNGNSYCSGQNLHYSYYTFLDTAGNAGLTKFDGGDNFNFSVMDMIIDLDGNITCAGFKDSLGYLSSLIYKFDSSGADIFRKEFLKTSNTDFTRGYNKDVFLKLVQAPDSSYYILGSIEGNPAIFHFNNNGDSLSSTFIPDSLGPNEIEIVRDFKYFNNKIYSCIQTRDTSAPLLYTKSFFHEIDITTNNFNRRNCPLRVNAFFPIDNDEKIILSSCPNNFGNLNSLIEKRDSNDVVLWDYCIHPQFRIFNTRFNLGNDGILFTSQIDSFNVGSNESLYYLKIRGDGTVMNIPDHSENTVDIFPNPVTNYLCIHTNNKITQVEIYDAVGNEILMTAKPESQFDTKGLLPGIYFISVETIGGRFSKKVIKVFN